MEKEFLSSKEMRKISAESDALHLGMGWSYDDLEKPHIVIESSYGESHPGSSHLLNVTSFIRDGIIEAGGKSANYIVTDMCDGVAQGSKGMNLSLASRDFMVNMIEIQVLASLCDGVVFVSSYDKSVPAHLMAAARLNKPAVIVPGGSMISGASFLACDQMWDVRRKKENKKISIQEYKRYVMGACPSAGACQMMGTASTMQVLAESLGLALTGSALIPVSNVELNRCAREAGKQILNLVEDNIIVSDIINERSIENAITIHAAVGGSTNAVVHLIALANEVGLEIDVDVFDKIHKRTPYLTNVLSTGAYPTEFFWYAGGVPAIMDQLRDFLNLDVLTVTGHTLGENIDNWLNNGNREKQNLYLKNYRTSPGEIIKSASDPIASDGGIAILKGNIAPLGSIVKHSAIVPQMRHHIGKAKVFKNEDNAITALEKGEIKKGDIIVLMEQGPKACGMPEMFRISEVITSNQELAETTAVITDGRYSGCTRGPAIGYISPEAYDNGPIGVIQDGDLIEIDIPNRKLNLLEGISSTGGVEGGDKLLEERLRDKKFKKKDIEATGKLKGVLDIYKKHVQPPLKGACIK